MSTRRTKRALLGAGAVAGILAMTGSAFTASNTMPAASVTKGYGSQTITGVTAESVTYNLNAPKDTVDSVSLVLTGDTTARTIEIAFNDAAPAACSGTGAFNATTDDTSYSCTISGGQSVSTATKFAVVAS